MLKIITGEASQGYKKKNQRQNDQNQWKMVKILEK